MKTATLRPVSVSQSFKFCPEIIFDAWIKPEIISKWVFVGPTSELINIKIDPTAGGRFSILELDRKNGEQIDHFGKYTLADRPGKLAFTLSVPKHFAGETNVIVGIKPQPGGCRLELTQTGVSAETTEKNWIDMLEKLNSVLQQMAKKTL